jgi:SprB repeat
VTDANNCTATLSKTITQPNALALSTLIMQVTCVGGIDGAIDLTVTGGTAPYTYAWTGGATTQDRTGLGAGTYTVIVTDANSCTATISAVLVALNPAPNQVSAIRH